MKSLHELSPDEIKEYVEMVNEKKLKPKINQTYLEAYIEHKEQKRINNSLEGYK